MRAPCLIWKLPKRSWLTCNMGLPQVQGGVKCMAFILTVSWLVECCHCEGDALTPSCSHPFPALPLSTALELKPHMHMRSAFSEVFGSKTNSGILSPMPPLPPYPLKRVVEISRNGLLNSVPLKPHTNPRRCKRQGQSCNALCRSCHRWRKLNSCERGTNVTFNSFTNRSMPLL